MNSKIAKKIRKYSNLRGNGDYRLDYKILKGIYQKASNKDKREYEKEMDQYISAVEAGRIKKGDSLILAGLPSTSSPAGDGS